MKQHAVFIDAWAWVALADSGDPGHARAAALVAAALEQRSRQVTSNMVAAEAVTLLRRARGHRAAMRLLELIAALVEDGRLELVMVEAATWAASVELFSRYDDQTFSLVDCTSFAIMHALGIVEALTADRHIAAAGFVPLGAI